MGHGYRGLAQGLMHMSPVPGVESAAYSRLIPNGAGAEYLWPFFQMPNVSDGDFARRGAVLRKKLNVLNDMIEGRR